MVYLLHFPLFTQFLKIAEYISFSENPALATDQKHCPYESPALRKEWEPVSGLLSSLLIAFSPTLATPSAFITTVA